MKCPNCDRTDMRVEETRNTGEVVYRVRRCPGCGWRVTTSEKYADEQALPNTVRRARRVK